MREETIKVCQFDELNEHAKEKAREWYRRVSADDTFWHETVIDDAADVLKKCGFDTYQRRAKLVNGTTKLKPAIYFSGFYSQGDGACFEGTWAPSDIMPHEQFCTKYPATWTNQDETPGHSESNAELQRIHAESIRLASLDPNNEVSWRCRQSGRGNAEYNTTFDHDDERCAHCESNSDCNDDGCVCKCDTCDPDRLDDAHEENARDAMRWIYRQLEREWEWINADEQVDESIRTNGYEFTEDGERY